MGPGGGINNVIHKGTKVKILSVIIAASIAAQAGLAAAAPSRLEAAQVEILGASQADIALLNSLGVTRATRLALQAHPAGLHSVAADAAAAVAPDPVASYETFVPVTAPPRLPVLENVLLTAYLDNVNDKTLAQLLALYHLPKSLLRGNDGAAVAHTIYAQYFLNRSRDLGVKQRWITQALAETDRKLNALIARGAAHDDDAADAQENHAAHAYFRDAFFNNHEENRYGAVTNLLNDFVRHPNNTLTNTFLTTATIWVGGEAARNDPRILQSFILSSYFSIRARALAERVEIRWQQSPQDHHRFRLATLIGGWSVPARRWLAKLHGDAAAVQALDQEHNQWLDINPAFHSVPVGLMLFEEPNWLEGLGAWQRGADACNAAPTNLVCLTWPYVSFNQMPFLLGQVDFLLKAGAVDAARGILALRNIPIDIFAGSFPLWDFGQDPWLHREENLERIAELYQNGDPGDDPSHFLLKQHKWGPGTILCQVCHERQGRQWAAGDVERTLSIADEFPPIGAGNWPAVSTTWYGATKRAP